MESSVVLLVISRFATAEMILSYDLPHLLMWTDDLKELDRFEFYFNSSYFFLFLATMRH